MYVYYWVIKCMKHMEAAKQAGNEKSYTDWYWAYKRMCWKAFKMEKEKIQKSRQ